MKKLTLLIFTFITFINIAVAKTIPIVPQVFVPGQNVEYAYSGQYILKKAPNSETWQKQKITNTNWPILYLKYNAKNYLIAVTTRYIAINRNPGSNNWVIYDFYEPITNIKYITEDPTFTNVYWLGTNNGYVKEYLTSTNQAIAISNGQFNFTANDLFFKKIDTKNVITYAASDNGLYISKDLGKTWNRYIPDLSTNIINKIFVSHNQIYTIANNHDLNVTNSLLYPKTWETYSKQQYFNNNDLENIISLQNRLYITTDHGIYNYNLFDFSKTSTSHNQLPLKTDNPEFTSNSYNPFSLVINNNQALFGATINGSILMIPYSKLLKINTAKKTITTVEDGTTDDPSKYLNYAMFNTMFINNEPFGLFLNPYWAKLSLISMNNGKGYFTPPPELNTFLGNNIGPNPGGIINFNNYQLTAHGFLCSYTQLYNKAHGKTISFYLRHTIGFTPQIHEETPQSSPPAANYQENLTNGQDIEYGALSPTHSLPVSAININNNFYLAGEYGAVYSWHINSDNKLIKSSTKLTPPLPNTTTQNIGGDLLFKASNGDFFESYFPDHYDKNILFAYNPTTKVWHDILDGYNFLAFYHIGDTLLAIASDSAYVSYDFGKTWAKSLIENKSDIKMPYINGLSLYFISTNSDNHFVLNRISPKFRMI